MLKVNSAACTDVPAVVLVGGMGTRLRSVLSSTPKPLAPLGDTPFLELLLTQLRAQGILRLIMCTGYLANQIEEQFGDGRKWGLTVRYSTEPRPMGTAGAIKLAERHLEAASDFVVMNGDSFVEVDFDQLIRFHREHKAMVSLTIRRVSNAARYGTVQVGKSNRITAFNEKTGVEEPALVNAGVYVFKRTVLQDIPDGPTSLEHDVFPNLLEQGVFAFEQNGMFIDIGTPEDYEQAQTLSGALRQAASAGLRP